MTIIIIPNEPNPNMTGRHYGIAKTMAAQGHSVHTVMWDLPQKMGRPALIKHLFSSLQTRDYRYENLQMHHFGRLPLFWPIINGWLFHRQLRRLFRTTNADIIFTQSFTNETSVPSELPYIYDLADDYYAPAEVFGSRLYKIMFGLLGVKRTMQRQARGALAVTAVSEVLCQYARDYNATVKLLPNGVETNIITKLKKPARVPAHSLIYVSGFGPWSQPLKVLRAATKLRINFPDLSLTLVGEGSEVSAIQQYIADQSAESYISYRGFIHDRQQVFELINQHAVGLALSEKNAWRDAAHPMKVIEYSALGKKVVSTDLVGVTALKLPNIYICSNDEPDGFERALRAALVTKQSSYPAVARKVRADYDWQHIVSQLTELMAAVTQSSGKLSIVHVTPSYPPVLGGLEKVVQVLAHTQAELGHTVMVLTSKTKLSDSPQSNVRVERFRNFVFANTIVMPRLLLRLLRISSGEAVHVHITQALTPELVWLASRIRGFKYIAHIHLDVPASGMAGFLLKIYKPLFLGRVLRDADYIVVFTADQQQEVHKKYGLPVRQIRIIPNGVEDTFYSDKPHHLHAPARLLFVGRLGYQKNLPQLFHALAGVSHKFVTTIVGDGELKQELEALASNLELKNITFTGRADSTQLRKHYQRADVFVLPSEREGMPLVLLEATAMGLPVVATDVTGNRDVIHNNQNGLLVPYGDAEALQAALLKITTRPALYGRLHKTARSMSDAYSWHKLVHEFETLYGDRS